MPKTRLLNLPRTFVLGKIPVTIAYPLIFARLLSVSCHRHPHLKHGAREQVDWRHVMIALADHKRRFILGGKPSFFPPGISRFVGGGIDAGETPEQAAVRELSEELGIVLPDEQLLP